MPSGPSRPPRRAHRRGWVRGPVLAGLLVASASGPLTHAPAAAVATVTINADPRPADLRLLSPANGRGAVLWVRDRTTTTLVATDGTAVQVQRLPEAKPGWPDQYAAPPEPAVLGGDQLGWVRLADEGFVQVRLDPATGVPTAISAPIDASGAWTVVGTDGTRLVLAAPADAVPAGTVGLKVIAVGGTQVRTISIPGFTAGLDVTRSGQVLVALTDRLAVVDLNTRAVTRLPFARTDELIWDATLEGDRVTYATGGYDAGFESKIRSCLISEGTCTTLASTTDYPRVVANARGFLWSASRLPSVMATQTVWGVWTADGARTVGRTSTGFAGPLARTGTALVAHERTTGRLVAVNPATGALTTVAAFADRTNTLTAVWLDAGAVLFQQEGRAGTAVTVRRTVTGTRRTGLTLGPPDVVGGDGTLRRALLTSGRWIVVEDDETPGRVLVRDGVRDAGSVTLPTAPLATVGVMSGAYWTASDTTRTVVWHGATQVATLPGRVEALGGPIAAAIRPGQPAAVYVTDVRQSGSALRVPVVSGTRIVAVEGRFLLLARTTTAPVRTTFTVLDHRTGATRYTRTVPGSGIGGLDGDVLVWREPSGSIRAVDWARDGDPVTVVSTGARGVDSVHGNRVVWNSSTNPAAGTRLVKVTAVPPPVAGARAGRLLGVVAARAATVGQEWSLSADVDDDLASGVSTGWRLDVTDADGERVARLTGRDALGAVRTSWIPDDAGSYTWTLTGSTASGGPIIGPLGEATISGRLTVADR